MALGIKNKKMKHKWKLFWSLIALYALGIAGFTWHTYTASVQLQAIQPTVMPTIEAIKIAFIMLGGLGVMVATFFSVYNSLETARTVDARIQFDRIENTYDLIKAWDAAALLEARKWSRELKAKHKDLSSNQLIAEIEGNANLKQSVILLLNYFDQLRVSVVHGRAVPSILSESLYSTFVDIFDRFKPYIAEKLSAKVMIHLNELKVELEKANRA